MSSPYFDFGDIEPDNYADDLSWDTPIMPAQNSLAVVQGDNVVLVRHFFSDNGDVEKIYGNYLDEKVSENDI